jgi:hypothetical protein
MADGRINNGGARPGAGRKPKVVEDAQTSVLFELFDEKAERAVILAQIRVAKRGDTTAATWLWDRKYGKVKDRVDQHTTLRIVIEDDDDSPDRHDPSS